MTTTALTDRLINDVKDVIESYDFLQTKLSQDFRLKFAIEVAAIEQGFGISFPSQLVHLIPFINYKELIVDIDWLDVKSFYVKANAKKQKITDTFDAIKENTDLVSQNHLQETGFMRLERVLQNVHADAKMTYTAYLLIKKVKPNHE